MYKNLWPIIAILAVLMVGAYFAYAHINGNQPNNQPPVATNPANLLPPQQPSTDQSKTTNIKQCPDTLIVNQMPQVVKPGDPRTDNSYYIWNNVTYRLDQFDAAWVKANCNVKTENVY